MWTALKNILDLIVRFFKAKDRHEKDQLDKAVIEKDKEAVNEYLNRRLRIIILCFILFNIFGCSSYTVIDADKEVEPITHNGKSGWFVPDARMLEIIQELNKE